MKGVLFRMAKFTIKESKKGFTFNLLASNGEVIGTSQTYTTKAGALTGIDSVRANAAIAAIDDITAAEPTESHPRFEIYLDKKKEFRFRLTAKNGKNILASEGYTEKASAKKGIQSVAKNAADAKLEG
jgi:uncharacterized protein YegP (UPF0339 family)